MFALEIGVQWFGFMLGVDGLRFRILSFKFGAEDLWMWAQTPKPKKTEIESSTATINTIYNAKH